MYLLDNVTFIMGSARFELFHQIYKRLKPHKQRSLSLSELDDLLVEVFSIPKARESAFNVLLESDLFSVKGDRCSLTRFGREIGNLCEEYKLWNAGASFGGTYTERYFKMLMLLGLRTFDDLHLEGYKPGEARRALAGFDSRGWLEDVDTSYRFNTIGLRFLAVVASMWAGTRRDDVQPSKKTLLVLAESFREAILEKGLVPKIKKLEAELDKGLSEKRKGVLETELAKHTRTWKKRIKGVPAEELEGLELAVFNHLLTVQG